MRLITFKPKRGGAARIGVMPLGGPTSAIRWFDLDPCYVFHTVNAFREGGKVMVDNANVVKTDIAASNGVIHVIDTVIMPK